MQTKALEELALHTDPELMREEEGEKARESTVTFLTRRLKPHLDSLSSGAFTL